MITPYLPWIPLFVLSLLGCNLKPYDVTDASAGGSTGAAAWPPVECGDVVCAEDELCVHVEAYCAPCSPRATAATTGSLTTGTSTTGTSTTGSGETGQCEDKEYPTTFECAIAQCYDSSQFSASCLADRHCPGGFSPAELSPDGVLDCGYPNHTCL